MLDDTSHTGRIEKTVFISYRRSTASGWALAISQNLTHHGYDVFFDYLGIASGDFEQVILANIRARAHFLVLLTPSALERLDEPGDWLRREIEAALASRRNIVPLMLEGFDFSAQSIASRLTGTLEPLKRYNGLTVHAEYFDEAMARLCSRHLNVPVDAVLRPLSAAARTAATEQGAAAASAAVQPGEELTADQWFERGFAAAAPDERLRCFSEVIRLKPRHAVAYHHRSIAHQSKGDVDSALRDLDAAIRLEPNDPDVHHDRAGARRAKGDLDGALEDLDEAVRLKPGDPDIHFDRGKARHTKGDLEGAIRDYDVAIRLRPRDADSYYNRGDIRRAKGDLDGALEDYNEAIRLKPDDPDAYNNRGKLRRAIGNLDGALSDYNEALRLKPDYAVVYNNRGVARRDKDDLDGALRDYDEALRLKPDYPAAYNNRGNARRAKGDLGGALWDFNAAIRLKPDLVSAYYNRAWVRERQSARLAAADDYQKYLDLGGGVRDGDQRTVEAKIRKLRQGGTT